MCQWGSMGEIPFLLSDPTEIVFLVNNFDMHHESFSQKKISYTKVIAKEPLTNLYEMNSNLPLNGLIIKRL